MDASPLLSLPNEVLCAVLAYLSTRDLLVATATCKAVRGVATTLPLRPTITVENSVALLRWLARPEVIPRVRTLSANNSVWGCHFLRKLVNLSRVSIRFSLLNLLELKWLPASLHAVELHRLCVGLGRPFYLSHLAHLSSARVLKLTFLGQDGLGHVFVSDTAGMPHLRYLSIRQAPRIVVMRPMRLHTLLLQATDGLLCSHSVHAAHLTLECLESPIMYEACLTAASCAQLRSLDIRCPGRDYLPDLRLLQALERLHVGLDAPVIHLGQLAAVEGLQRVTIDARYGVHKIDTHASLPARVTTAITVGGVPLTQQAVDNFFNVLPNGDTHFPAVTSNS